MKRVTDIEEALRDLLGRTETSLENIRFHEAEGLHLLCLARKFAPRFCSLLAVGADLESHLAYLEEMDRLRGNGDDDDAYPF